MESITLDLDSELASLIRSAAPGLSLHAAAELVLRDALSSDFAATDQAAGTFDDPGIAEDLRRLAEYDRSGLAYDGAEYLAWMKADLQTPGLPKPRVRRHR